MIVPMGQKEYHRAIIYKKLLQRRDVLRTATDVMYYSHVIDRAVQQSGYKPKGIMMEDEYMDDGFTLNEGELDTTLTLNNGWLPMAEINKSKASRGMGVTRRSLITSHLHLESVGLIRNNMVDVGYSVVHGGFFELLDADLPSELRIAYSWLVDRCEHSQEEINTMSRATLAEAWGCSIKDVCNNLYRLAEYGKITFVSSDAVFYRGFVVKDYVSK